MFGHHTSETADKETVGLASFKVISKLTWYEVDVILYLFHWTVKSSNSKLENLRVTFQIILEKNLEKPCPWYKFESLFWVDSVPLSFLCWKLGIWYEYLNTSRTV